MCDLRCGPWIQIGEPKTTPAEDPADSLLYLTDETDENAKKCWGNIVETLILTYIGHILTRRQQKPEFTNF